jgi:hypothetical protein
MHALGDVDRMIRDPLQVVRHEEGREHIQASELPIASMVGDAPASLRIDIIKLIGYTFMEI